MKTEVEMEIEGERELGNTIQKKTLCCVYVCIKQGLTKERGRVRKERKEEGKKGKGSHEHEHKKHRRPKQK